MDSADYLPLPPPAELTEEQKAGGYVVIAQLYNNIRSYRPQIEAWADAKIGDLRAEAIARGLVPGGWPEANAYSRGKLVGLLYAATVEAVKDDYEPTSSVDIPPSSAS